MTLKFALLHGARLRALKVRAAAASAVARLRLHFPALGVVESHVRQLVGTRARIQNLVLTLLPALLLAGDVSAMGAHRRAVEGVRRALQLPEAMLVQALIDIRDNRMSAALERVNALLALKPDFRLAQLIKGDLLMARARPINSMGAANAPLDRINGLREEARARLARYELKAPIERLPKYLLQMQPQQHFAIVVDTAKSTLYLFENREGSAHYLSDYYITVGKNGTNKSREGDKKTPLGVYQVTSQLPQSQVGTFYGSGAFPLSYPNEWDERQGRNGHGIWLHGTSKDTYSRPPRASDGCVVLTNEDLDDLKKHLQIGVTPVVIADSVEWVDAPVTIGLRAGLTERIERWRHDWESRNTDQYLQHYARAFATDGMDRSQWGSQKRRVNAGKEWIKVELSDVSMFLYPGHEDLAVVSFSQDYTSSNLSNKMRKRQYWIKEDGVWKILYEGAV